MASDPGEGTNQAEPWRCLVDTLSDPVCVLDADGRVTRCNKALLRLLGKEHPDTFGHVLFDLVRGSAGEDLLTAQFTRAKDARAAQTAVHLVRDRWFEVKLEPMLGEDGSTTGCACTMRDITDRRRSDEALQRNLAFEEAILEGTPSLIIVADEPGHVIYINTTGREITGYRLEDVLQKPVFPAFFPEETWQKLVSSAASRAEAGGSPLDVPLKTSNGEERVVSWRTSRIVGHEAGKMYFVCAGSDITIRRKVEEQLSQSEKLSALGELIAGVAHELNNPLTGVIGYAELLAMSEGIQPAVVEDLRVIEKSARRCKTIVDNLLRFARQRKPESKPVDMHSVIEDSLQLLEYQLRVANIEVVRDFGRAVPPVKGDYNQLAQVIVNLVGNAQQAMHRAHGSGKLVIATNLNRHMLRIRFTDNGPGIPPGHLSRIFDPFYTTKPVGEGTGLGLSVCFGIIATHRGKIWAQSEEGEGATFVIELPTVAAEEAPVEAASEAPKIMRLRQRVLVVDDEAVVLDVLNKMLTALGFVVSVASNGEKALALLEAEPFDLVISDYRMPGLDGPAFYEAAVAKRETLRKRFIFCTGDTVSRETRNFLDKTGCRVVTKPFNFDELAGTLAKMQRELAGEGAAP